MSITSGDLDRLNRTLEGSEPQEILRWAAKEVPRGRLMVSTAFGVGGIVLIHLLRQEGIRLPVVFVDTFHHFPETLDLADRVRERYDLDLRIVRPALTVEAFQAEYGPRLWKEDVSRFHQVTKVDPMHRALTGVRGWITARRRDQAPSRTRLPILEAGRYLRINPIVGWTRERVWTFVRTHDLPYNPLHDRGYPSVGDRPLTTPVAPGEGERAGRWRGSDRMECGLHSL